MSRTRVTPRWKTRMRSAIAALSCRSSAGREAQKRVISALSMNCQLTSTGIVNCGRQYSEQAAVHEAEGPVRQAG